MDSTRKIFSAKTIRTTSSVLFHDWDACATLRSTMAREPGLTLRQIGLTSDRALEMVLLRVATRTLFGKPIICCKCRSALASWAHVTSCLFDFGQMLANGSLLHVPSESLMHSNPALVVLYSI